MRNEVQNELVASVADGLNGITEHDPRPRKQSSSARDGRCCAPASFRRRALFELFVEEANKETG